MKKENIDVLVICALLDEYKQVISIKQGIWNDVWEEKVLDNGRLVADAKLLTKDNTKISIRATWASYMGREEISALVHSMFSQTDFKCIVMTGICAGRRGHVSLGDVIFAERLWSYDAGKLIKENDIEVFQGDMLQYRPNTEIVQRMQRFTVDTSKWGVIRPKYTLEEQERWVVKVLASNIIPSEHIEFDEKCPDWQLVLSGLIKKELVTKELNLTDKGVSMDRELSLFYPKGFPEPTPLRIHVAPIATGASVVEDVNLFSRLSHSMRKVLGVDMEASALGAIGDTNDIPVIVVKAVSDFGDMHKDDRYRYFAAHASAQCMLQFLRDNSDLFSYQVKGDSFLFEELIAFLAEEYPDTVDARAVWKRAGGANSDIASNPRPKDMWLNIWQKSINGAVVTPINLLEIIANDYPENKLIKTVIHSFVNKNRIGN